VTGDRGADAYRTAAGVVLAGGSGSRLGAAANKVYLPLAGRPVLAWSLRAFAAAGVGRLVLVVRPVDRPLAEQAVAWHAPLPVDLVHGGASRHDSEHNALVHLAPLVRRGEVDVVAVHDGARPLVRPALVRASIDAARAYGAAVPGIPVDDVAAVSAGAAASATGELTAAFPDTASGGRLVRVQTPQAFRAGPLLDAYERAAADGFTGTDTSACVERYAGMRVHHFPGDVRNLKVTFRHDLAVAEELARALH
jgi:2-C-methyl-D-erythritol 4-phosphate cytidylyltransferase